MNIYEDEHAAFALTTADGTACAETVLRADENTPEMRSRIEQSHCLGRPDDPIVGSWVDVSGNDLIGGGS